MAPFVGLKPQFDGPRFFGPGFGFPHSQSAFPMQIERGKAVAPGFGDGRAHVYRPGSPRLVTCGIAPSAVAAEQARFSAALARATERLERLEHAARTELGPDNGDIFAAHLALLRDSQFIERINGRIATQLESAEQAIDATVGEL